MTDGTRVEKPRVACCDRPAGCEKYESPLIRKVFQLHHMMMRVGDRLAGPHGLTSSRWMLLGCLGKSDEPRTIAEISEEILLSPQNVSRMVVSMEADGLVVRNTIPGSGRSVYVGLTETGWRAYGLTKGLAERFLTPFLDGFSESRIERLDRDLKKLMENTQRFEQALIAEAQEKI
ncbi:MAG: winged helix-turn-helix transcriptional regulator [Phycisphaeraceae bacterium]|nr:MAG: winged helix-turn-helix transcriptional regulator [Phycisphaeraceae bacterium]